MVVGGRKLGKVHFIIPFLVLDKIKSSQLPAAEVYKDPDRIFNWLSSLFLFLKWPNVSNNETSIGSAILKNSHLLILVGINNGWQPAGSASGFC